MTWLKVVPSWLGIVVWLLVGLAVGWTVNGWRLDSALSAEQKAHSDTLAEIARAGEAQLRVQRDQRLLLEQQLAQLDSTQHKELADAQAENDRLRLLYSDAGNELKRLRIDVKVARADATVSAATSSGSVGDGASVELSDRAGRAVWDIRAGIKRDQAKLKYLQEYAKHVSQHPSP